MELVDANTKNYLFLTMSQYNDQDKLVRARVSMRRDQAFWQGGNSFVACESFRISAAPSQGGLYYTILPDTFYLGAANHGADPQSGAAYANFLKSNTAAFPGYTVYSAEIKSSSGDEANIQVGDTLVMDFNMGIYNAGAAPNEIPESHPEKILPVLGELWNDHGVALGSDIQLLGNAGAFMSATVQNNPLSTISGAGIGPDKLFYPITGWWEPVGDDEMEDACTKLLAGNTVCMTIYNMGYDKLVPDDAFEIGLDTLFGADCRFEITKGADGSFSSVPAALREGGLEFVAPGRDPINFVGITDFYDDNDVPTKKLYWDTVLHDGTRVYTKAPDGTITYGTIGDMDRWISKLVNAPQGISDVSGAHLTGWFKLTDAYKTWLNNNANSWGTYSGGDADLPATGVKALKNMLNPQFPWVMYEGTQHLPNEIRTTLNLKVTGGSAGFANTMKDQLPNIQTQIKPLTHRKSQHIERRACAPGETKYIYTPNELYWLFNNPQGLDDGAKSPYLLQTDENGGFKVEWDGTYQDFYMSVEMHTALGLNDYFEHAYTKTDSSKKAWDLCLQRKVIDASLWETSYTSNIVHLGQDKVFTKDVTPLTPVDAATIPIGTEVWTDVDTTYILVSKSLIETTVQEADVLQVKPVYLNDPSGTPYYLWRNLPAATMHNTQQVSVESFGTFSGINIVIPNLPFQPMLGTASDDRILASLRLPFEYGTDNKLEGTVSATDFSYYGDLLFNSDSSRSYLRITTDQQLYDCDVEARLIRRDGGMEVLYLPYKGQFEIKLRFLQTQ